MANAIEINVEANLLLSHSIVALSWRLGGHERSTNGTITDTTDRLMLLVKMFAKLILLAFREISDLHATFAMADHPPA